MKYLFLITCFLSYSVAQSQSSTTPLEIVEELGADFAEGSQFSIAVIEGTSIQYYGYVLQENKYISVDNHNSIFEIGSITKVFTSTLLAQAIVDKKVKAQQLLKTLVPFKLKGKPKITLEQLSNHTSGLPRLPENIFLLLTEDINNPYKLYNKKLLEKYASKELRLNHKPGEQFAYSNLGAGILGYALGNAYKKPYEQLLEELVFEPFKLTNTYTRANQVPKGQLIEGLGVDGKPVPNWDWDVLAPAGCILSSVEDLSLFAKINLDAKHPALKRQQQVSFKQDEKLSLALGWLLLNKDGQEYYFHNGATGGYTASILLDKENNKGVVILSNISGMHPNVANVDQMALKLLQAL